jgi:hypothetical protein
MKTLTLQNRLSVISILGLFAIAVFLVLQTQPADSSALVQMQSSTSYGGTKANGIVAQIESVLAMSAKQVFNKDYWIANMHSIQRF